ncbi:MAG: 2Fe-2S iron-sulfur cluster-binding protein, partial [Vulcanimicrobiaceae bacterium]
MASERIIRCNLSHRAQITAKGVTREFPCDEGEHILYAGLRAGLALPYECASGTCGTCRASVVAGETEYAWPDAPGRKYTKPARNEVLMCQSVARADVALE